MSDKTDQGPRVKIRRASAKEHGRCQSCRVTVAPGGKYIPLADDATVILIHVEGVAGGGVIEIRLCDEHFERFQRRWRESIGLFYGSDIVPISYCDNCDDDVYYAECDCGRLCASSSVPRKGR